MDDVSLEIVGKGIYLRSEKKLVVRILWDHSTPFIPNATGMIVNPLYQPGFHGTVP